MISTRTLLITTIVVIVGIYLILTSPYPDPKRAYFDIDAYECGYMRSC